MYEIKVKSSFSGAHKLRGYKGKCEELHGHNWHVEAVAGAEELDELGMVLDFKDFKATLNECLLAFDHKYLNDIEHFKKVNPTSENMAKYIYEDISAKLTGVVVKRVTVWETHSSSATYYG